MATFTVGCKIANHEDRSRSKVVLRVLVDTGSGYTWIAGSTLREIGIQPEKKMRAVMANGAILERDMGFALVYERAPACGPKEVGRCRSGGCRGGKPERPFGSLTWGAQAH